MIERSALRSLPLDRQAQEQIRKLSEENKRLSARLRELEELQRRDALTGLLDRGGVDTTLEREWLRARRGRLPLGLVFIDLDRFKEINDAYGHPAGDGALKAAAQAIELEARRSSEIAGRYGGDEFVVLVPQADLAATLALGERIRQGVAQARFTVNAEKQLPLSVSVGAASVVATMEVPVSELLRRADRALYTAKERGRGLAVGCDVEDGSDVMFGVQAGPC